MKIQSTIAGFAGQPVSLVASLDKKTGVIVVVKEIKFREERAKEDFVLVSNLDLPSLDLRFSDDLIRDSIRAYFTRKAQITLDLHDAVKRFAPDQKIEQDAVDEGGRRYRLSPDIQNGQVAILAIVALVEHQSGFSPAVNFANEMAEFYRVESI